MNRYEEIVKEWNYEGSCGLLSFWSGKFQMFEFFLHRVYRQGAIFIFQILNLIAFNPYPANVENMVSSYQC
jgi:hypothetical protein